MSEPDTTGVQAVPAGITINVYVAPRASTNKIVGLHDGALKIALTAPPVEGAANKALIEFLAKVLGVPKGSVSLLSGETSRRKVVRVQGVDVQQALHKLISPT